MPRPSLCLVLFHKKKTEKKKMLKDMSKVKLPSFLYNSPQTWWLTCKSIFAMFKIKNASKRYNHLVASCLLTS